MEGARGSYALACQPCASTCQIQSRGEITFSLSAGTENAGRQYVLLGSTSGWNPGIPWGGYCLRINWDWFTTLSFMWINTPVFQDFMGTLNGKGEAKAQFSTLGNPLPSPPFYPGDTLHFAYVLFNPKDYASNPVQIWIE